MSKVYNSKNRNKNIISTKYLQTKCRNIIARKWPLNNISKSLLYISRSVRMFNLNEYEQSARVKIVERIKKDFKSAPKISCWFVHTCTKEVLGDTVQLDELIMFQFHLCKQINLHKYLHGDSYLRGQTFFKQHALQN